MKFKEGQRVKLKANRAEGWTEEHGVYEGQSGKGMSVVRVDKKYRDDRR
jgi:hypothetical protein